MAEILSFAIGGESNDYKWTEIAFDLMTEGKLTVALTGPTGDRVVARGQCPRCEHDVAYAFNETIVVPQGYGGTLSAETTTPAPTAGTSLGDRPTVEDHYVTVPILCQCLEEHTGRPAKSRGCGIVFNTELRAP
jgi:hypothetical protein